MSTKKQFKALMVSFSENGNSFPLISRTIPAMFAYEGSGAGDDPETDEFKIDVIPEEHRKSFEKFKQTLIDKGVDIGTGRARTKYEKEKSAEVENFLKEEGLSKEDIQTLKPLLANKASLKKLYEVYGTEDLEEIAQMIEAAEDAEKTELEKLAGENAKLSKREKELLDQIDAIKNGKSTELTELSAAKQKAIDKLEKHLVENRLFEIAKENGAYSPEDIPAILKSQIRLEEVDGDYVPYVVNDKGYKRFDSNGNPVSIESIVVEYLEKKPHLVKSGFKPGHGSSSKETDKKTGQKTIGAFTADQLRDPKFFQDHQKEILEAVKQGKVKL